MIEIRRADYCDLESILELQKRCYRENAERYDDYLIQPLTQSLEDIREEFRKGTVLKAVYGEKIVGSIRGYVESGTGYVNKVIVDPDYQNRGIGSSLVAALEKALDDVKRFELFTGYKDEKNLHLYGKLGYRKYKEEKQESMIFIYLEKWKM